MAGYTLEGFKTLNPSTIDEMMNSPSRKKDQTKTKQRKQATTKATTKQVVLLLKLVIFESVYYCDN